MYSSYDNHNIHTTTDLYTVAPTQKQQVAGSTAIKATSKENESLGYC